MFAASQGFLAASILPSGLALAGEAILTNGPALDFFVIGDWGRRGNACQSRVAGQMAALAEVSKPSFILSVGDNFYEDGVCSVKDPQWEESFEKVYHQESLQVPWYSILGNHDYHSPGNCDAQTQYHQVNARWNMPARYYKQSFKIDSSVVADFFFLDTTPMIGSYYSLLWGRKTRLNVMTQDVPAQLAWFRQALQSSTAPWKIVAGHHPIFSGGGHGDSQELIESILPLLNEFNVHAYFNGHDHDLQHLVSGRVNFFDSGSGSSHNPTFFNIHSRFSSSSPGFAAVRMTADYMQVRMMNDHGRCLYSTMVPRV